MVVIYAKGFYPSPHARYGHILAFFRTNLPSPSIVRSAHASHILINSGTGSFYPAFFLSRIKSVLSQCVHFYFFFYFFLIFLFYFPPFPCRQRTFGRTTFSIPSTLFLPTRQLFPLSLFDSLLPLIFDERTRGQDLRANPFLFTAYPSCQTVFFDRPNTSTTIMSEQPVVQPEEPTAAEAAPATTEQVTEAILSKDPEVVEANLAKAGPVVTDPIEPVTADAAPAAATDAAPAATTEETPAATEATPAETPAPAKKEGSTLVAFLKKAIPNPKSVDKKTAKPETPAKTETETAPATEVVEPATEEGPFEGDAVSFKSHGGIFGCLI